MKALTWTISILLTLLILFLSILGTFHDDLFYRYAYARNGAYTHDLPRSTVWEVTENFQAYLKNENSLSYFPANQAAHLADVKQLYQQGTHLARLLLGLTSILLFSLAWFPERKRLLAQTFKHAAQLSLGLLFVLGLLALNWNWFFTGFHQLFFSGNWQFYAATLMLKLWGNQFFVLAAGYVLIKCLAASAFLFFSSSIILRRLR